MVLLILRKRILLVAGGLHKIMEQTVKALLPIKENSERVPEKNFRDFNGRPLYHWMVDTLSETEEIDTIIINTDAEQIIKNAPEKFDVEVSVRPDELRGDHTSMNKIIEYEVNRSDADIFLQTHCTNPLLKSETISSAVQKFVKSEDSDALFTVTRHQKMLYDENLNPINHDPDELIRTQDLPPVYEDNSNLFVFTEETIKRMGRRTGENPIIYEMDEIESIDIDTHSDFEMAEYFHKKRGYTHRNKP